MATFLALLSWLSSYVTWITYDADTWQCLVSLLLIDLVFMFLISKSRVNYIKTKWMCWLIFISIVFLSVFTLVTYALEYKLIGYNSLLYTVFEVTHGPLGFIISLLMLLVAMAPQKLISTWDYDFWPHSIDNIFIPCDSDSYQDIKSGE
jgi:hypothetical protein